MTSVIFVGVSALLYVAALPMVPEVALLRVLPAYFLLSMLFNYAYETLEDVANGMREPPVASVESLGPFELRPIVQVALCAVVYKLAMLAGVATGSAIALFALALLPASIGVLGTTGRWLAAVDPVMLLRTVKGLGWCYPLIVAVAVAYAAAVLALSRTASDFVWFAAGEFAVLSLFSLIGGAFHLRRLQLGFEPRRSPERMADVAEMQRLARLDHMLDDMFVSIRARKSAESIRPLQAWLTAADAAHLAQDTRAVIAQALQWNSPRGLEAVARALVSELLRRKRPDLALEVVNAAVGQQPQFAVESAAERVQIARYAASLGRPGTG